MSWQASKWAAQVRTGSASAKAALLVLAEASSGSPQPSCIIGHATIADRAEMSVRTVQDALKRLAELGLIRVERRYSSRGHRASDEITLCAALPEKSADRPTGKPRAPNRQMPRGLPAKSAGDTYTPILEPVSEPVDSQRQLDLVEVTPRSRSGRKKPARPLPDDCPNADALQWAMEAAGRGIDLQAEAAKFRDWHTAKDSRFADWSAAWRTWIRKSVEWRNERPAGARDKLGSFGRHEIINRRGAA